MAIPKGSVVCCGGSVVNVAVAMLQWAIDNRWSFFFFSFLNPPADGVPCPGLLHTASRAHSGIGWKILEVDTLVILLPVTACSPTD